MTLIGRILLVRLRRSGDCSYEWTLVLLLSLVNFQGVSPISKGVLAVDQLLVLAHLLVSRAQLLDCVILLLLVHDLLRLLFRYLDLHVP